MTDANYRDIVLLTPAQAESLLHNLEQTSGSIGVYVNANKTEFMYFKESTISTLKWQSSEISRLVHIVWQQHQLKVMSSHT